MGDARLSRGRTYARKGQVTDLELGSGTITAKVQGSSSRPYKVSISMDVLDEAIWQKIADHFSNDASMMAALLGGNLPEKTEDLFSKLRISFIPKSQREIEMDCSCPDWAIPCKHAAAVIYLVGEEIDRDPFILFQLRGKSRDEFMAMLDDEAFVQIEGEDHREEPLPHRHEEFWKDFNPSIQAPLSFQEPQMDAILAKRLGGLPFWQGEDPFIETMERLYHQGSINAAARYFADEDST